jgi:hypothetical protein
VHITGSICSRWNAILFLLAVALLASLMIGHAQRPVVELTNSPLEVAVSPAEELSYRPVEELVYSPADDRAYEENFDDRKAQGWELEEGWTIYGGELMGRGHSWARYEDTWGEGPLTFKFNLVGLEGGIHANVNINGPDRYAIGLVRTGDESLSTYLFKQVGEISPSPSEHPPEFRGQSIDYDPNQEYQVEIVSENGNIQVYVYKVGQESGERLPVIDYYDPDPLPPGKIAFETLEGSSARLDDVVVIGPSPTDSEPRQADLAISSLDWNFFQEKGELALYVDIENQGSAESRRTEIRAVDSERDWLQESASVAALGPDETTSAEIRLKIPEELRDTRRIFIIEVDPVSGEPNVKNNLQKIEVQIPPRAEERLPDLVISSAGRSDIFENELVLFVNIRNQGNARSDETVVRARDSERDWLEGLDSVAALGPNETASAVIRLEIPEEQWGDIRTFIIEVDPVSGEPNQENNQQAIEIRIPPREEVPDGGGQDGIPNLQVVGVAAVALVALGLGGISFHRRGIKIKLHKKWQEKGEEGDLPKECLHCNYHCRKEPDLELSLLTVIHLDLIARDPVSGHIDKRQLASEVIDDLNAAVDRYRLRKDREKLQQRILPISQKLLQHIGEWLHDRSALFEVIILGHREGSKVPCKFTLFHCEEENQWKKVDEWKATIEYQDDKAVGTLQGFDPDQPEALEGELCRMLIQFIENF